MRRLSIPVAALALAVLLLAVGLGPADEVNIVILKIEGKRVTALPAVKKGGKAEETAFFLKDGVKVTRGTFNKDTKKIEPGDPVEGGIMNEIFSSGKVSARVVIDANRMISEIRVMTLKKK